MKDMAKTVLVSGGAGYIGSHVTVELISAGYEVVVADNMSNCDTTCFEGVKKITGREDIPFYQIDCCDHAAVDMVFNAHKIDAVIHFAAFKAVGESVDEPIMYYRNNLTSFLNVLDAAKANALYAIRAITAGELRKHFDPDTQIYKDICNTPTFIQSYSSYQFDESVSSVTDFYQFTKDSFKVEDYQYHPFDFDIPMAI